MDAGRAPADRRGSGAGFRDDGVTTLAHDATLLGIPVDTGRLYDGDDPGYELFLWALITRLQDTIRQQNA
jgi:hypothetical protein